MNEHKVIGYEIYFDGPDGKTFLTEQDGSFYILGDGKSAKEFAADYKDENPGIRKIRFKEIFDSMQDGDAFCFDAAAFRKYSEIAKENNIDYPEDWGKIGDDDMMVLALKTV